MNKRLEKMISLYGQTKRGIQFYTKQVEYYKKQAKNLEKFCGDDTGSPNNKYWRSQMDYNLDMAEQSRKQAQTLRDDIALFESALDSLTDVLKDIMTDLLINDLTWDEVILKYHIGRTTLYRYRKKALEQMSLFYDQYEEQLIQFILS